MENNNGDKKGHPVMIIFAILAVIFFATFVFPAMEKGDKGPTSVLSGE